MIAASVLHVETLQQIASDYYEYDKIEEVIKYLPTLAMKLVSKIKKDYSGLQTLAILAFAGVEDGNADVLAQLLAIELVNSGKYTVISRTSTIKNAMEEQNIQRSRLTDESTMSKLVEATNAQYVLSGSVSGIEATDLINVTIIETLTLVQKGGAYVKYKTVEEGMELMSVLSYKLTGKLNALSLEDAIAIYDGENVSRIKILISKDINAAEDNGFTPL